MFGDRNDFGSFEKRTLGYRLVNRLSILCECNWFKNTGHCNWYVFQGLLFLLCFDLACEAGRIVRARKVWQSGAAKPRGMVCKILYKVLRKFRGLSETLLSPYAVAVILATGDITSNQFTCIPKGNVFYVYSVFYITVTCICRGNWKEKCWTECRDSRNKSNGEVSGSRTRWFITASGRENWGNYESGGKKNTAGMFRCFFYNCVHSIRKSGFRFWNPGFGFSIDCEIWKRISTLNNGLARALIVIAENRPLFTRQFCKSVFSDFPNKRIWISWLKSTFRTDFSEVKSVFAFDCKSIIRISRYTSRFSNRRQPWILENVLKLVNQFSRPGKVWKIK